MCRAKELTVWGTRMIYRPKRRGGELNETGGLVH